MQVIDIKNIVEKYTIDEISNYYGTLTILKTDDNICYWAIDDYNDMEAYIMSNELYDLIKKDKVM